jgi:DNA-binding response OmpR family regulator
VTPNAEILVIEDDPGVGHLITTVLRRHGFEVALAATGRAGLAHFDQHPPGVVVLDVGLPDLDGWQVLQRIREGSAVPVLMLTGHADEPDKVRGLRGGADDYLTKPFGIDEFTARVEALLRRGHRALTPPADVFVDGNLYVDFDRREVKSGGEEVTLTSIEFKLLAALVHRPGQVITGDELLRLAWDDGSGVASDRVKFSVHRLRRKLGWESPESSPIEAVRGVGYRYRIMEPAAPGRAGEHAPAGEPAPAGEAVLAGESGIGSGPSAPIRPEPDESAPPGPAVESPSRPVTDPPPVAPT